MNDYNFWADFLDTFQSSPDWIKAVWLLAPPCFLLALMAMLVRWRIGLSNVDSAAAGELIYSIRRDSNNMLHITRHASLGDGNPLLMMPPLPSAEEPEAQSLIRLAPPE